MPSFFSFYRGDYMWDRKIRKKIILFRIYILDTIPISFRKNMSIKLFSKI